MGVLYGSKTTVSWTLLQYVRNDMTAISITYGNAGFVIAADGRCRQTSERELDPEVLKEESDSEQKIFPGNSNQQSFGYALTGAIFNKGKTFNMVVESKLAIDRYLGVTNLKSDLTNVGDHLNNYLATARADGRIDKYPDMDTVAPGVIARVFLVGYFEGQRPSLIGLTLHHANQVLQSPHIQIQTPPMALLRIGSTEVLRLTDTRDGRFATFYRPPLQLDSSLTEAIDWAKAYIDACSSPEALEIDPLVCKGIGGHVHIAAITLKAGFQWVPGFEPIPNT